MFRDTQLVETHASTRGLRIITNNDPHPPAHGVYRVVASEGAIEDWAAYLESQSSRDLGNDIQAIHDYGHKISQVDAERLFPDWAERLTWRP